MTSPLLTVRGVKTYYGRVIALKGVDIDVNEGEIVTLIGANGAGKSTLMMTIFGSPQAREGRVLYEGRDITQRGGTLSGGEQQMLAIARALMSRPRLLLLDEPSLGLAPLIVRQIFSAIKTLNEQEGLSVFLVEQNAFHALRLAHRGYVMVNGLITLSGTGRELLERQEVKAAYLEGGRQQAAG